MDHTKRDEKPATEPAETPATAEPCTAPLSAHERQVIAQYRAATEATRQRIRRLLAAPISG
jgi:hypothetical protein